LLIVLLGLRTLVRRRRPRRTKKRVRKEWQDKGYASEFEYVNACNLEGRGIPFEYEQERVKYQVERTYTPDFKLLTKSGKTIYIETKGWFQSSDRSKHKKIKEQHPDLDIRFVFQNSSNKLNKQSKTTYAQWCDKHGFKWAEALVPKEWVNE
jgi:predicted nuclease of restriction endonuclease-like RecB superfamily